MNLQGLSRTTGQYFNLDLDFAGSSEVLSEYDGPGDNGSESPSASVPEPSTLILLGMGMLGMGIVKRRKQ